MAYFDYILHTNARQHCLTFGMCNSLFDGRGFAEHDFSRLWSVSENAHNSRTAWYIWIKFCILIYLKILFFKFQETLKSNKSNNNFYMGASYKQVSISRYITHSSKKCTNPHTCYTLEQVRLLHDPWSAL